MSVGRESPKTGASYLGRDGWAGSPGTAHEVGANQEVRGSSKPRIEFQEGRRDNRASQDEG